MRNLKKILALALALTMILSVTASAAFTDADKIDADYAEAVTVLNGLQVFQGRDTGDFDPKADINRAEVAAIIYRITTGDVENKKVAMFVDMANFSDVPANMWAAGYIGYCANAGYVKGYPNGTFAPYGKVTGMEALTMILRAIGYDAQNEFSGAQWSNNVAKVAGKAGILDDVKPGLLVGAASRELVAQLLFAAIAKAEIVDHNVITGYSETGKTLGEKIFDLAEVDGILTANEYADLNSDEVLDAGEIAIDDVVYNYAGTDLTVIGHSFKGWAADDDILYFADSGKNATFSTGAETTVKKSKIGMDIDENTQYFINFEETGASETTADIKIKYVIKFKKADILTDEADAALKKALTDNKGDYIDADGYYTYTKSIKAGAALTALDLEYMKSIFTGADKIEKVVIDGEVYVGTQTGYDISDVMTWKSFDAKYLETATDDNTKTFSANANGEWLKAVDNDNNGYADYVFLTTFAMAEVSDVTKKGIVTIDNIDVLPKGLELDELVLDSDKITFVADEGLAEGDIVLATYIDGVYYVNLAETAVGTVDKNGYDRKNVTLTCGEAKYEESGIWYSYAENMEYKLEDATEKETYDFYLDHFGFVRMFDESAYNRGFVLLTDGYYETDKRDEVFKAEIWDGEFKDVNVVDAKYAKNPDHFINDSTYYGEKEWDRLWKSQETYEFGTGYSFLTNLAGFTMDENNDYTLVKIDEPDAISNKVVYEVSALDVVESGDYKTGLKDKTLNSADDKIGTVQTTTQTIYYLVTLDSYGEIDSIQTWVGYKNAPATAELGDDFAGYVVTVGGKNTDNYDVAKVVVYETNVETTKDLYFVYDKNTYDAITVGYDETDAKYEYDLYVDLYDRKYAASFDESVEFYIINDKGIATNVDTDELGDYAAEGIYLAEVLTNYDVDNYDYVKVTRYNTQTDTSTKYFSEGDCPIYKVKKSSSGVYSVAEMDYDDIQIDDVLIMVYGDSLNYVINISESLLKADRKTAVTYVPTELTELVEAIWADAADVVVTYYTVNNVGEYELEDEAIVENLTGEFAKVESSIADTYYAPIDVNGEVKIEVTGNMTVTGGYYDIVLNGETLYVTDAGNDGKMTKTELLALVPAAEQGTVYEWTIGNGNVLVKASTWTFGGGDPFLTLTDKYAGLDTRFANINTESVIYGETDVEEDGVFAIGTEVVYTNTTSAAVVLQNNETPLAVVDAGETYTVTLTNADMVLETVAHSN